ncbi:histone-fold-containing protein [Xylariales sp. PMI_506]|nr:histone-fold-containing protein [Xylariales sp. PMI_506]
MARKSDVAKKPDTPVGKANGEASNSQTPAAAAAAAVASPAPPGPKVSPAEGADTEQAAEPVAAPAHAEKKDKDKDAVTIEDLNLPKSIITRLAKGVLPPNTQIQANAILAITKAATVFINHLANAANEKTLASGKKTIMPPDVFDALEDIEYTQFREIIQAEFQKFNDIQTAKRTTYRRKVAAAKKGVPFVDPNASTLSTDASQAGLGEDIDDSTAALGDVSTVSGDGLRSAKKQKPNGPHDDSAMDVDNSEDFQDAESEPEQEEEEEEEEEGDEEEEDDDDEEDNEEEGEDEEDDDEMHDALEEREQDGGDDEALDNGEDSDA